MSFCGSKEVILWVYRCHFEGVKTSFCGLKMSFYSLKDVISGSKDASFYSPFGCKIFDKRICILCVGHFVVVKTSFCGSTAFIVWV